MGDEKTEVGRDLWDESFGNVAVTFPSLGGFFRLSAMRGIWKKILLISECNKKTGARFVESPQCCQICRYSSRVEGMADEGEGKFDVSMSLRHILSDVVVEMIQTRSSRHLIRCLATSQFW